MSNVRFCQDFGISASVQDSNFSDPLGTISKSHFSPSWNVQPTERYDVLAKLESAMFWPSSDQQTEPECGSLEDKLLRRTSPAVRELSLKRPQDRCLLRL